MWEKKNNSSVSNKSHPIEWFASYDVQIGRWMIMTVNIYYMYFVDTRCIDFTPSNSIRIGGDGNGIEKKNDSP